MIDNDIPSFSIIFHFHLGGHRSFGKTVARTVAVKLWDAETFSDGTALSEWAANRVASQPGHEALVQVLGTFEDTKSWRFKHALKCEEFTRIHKNS